VDDDTVWLESIYVVPAMRRMGLATELFRTVEELAVVCGGDTVYNYVHPNNHPMIAFLKRYGYDVLNLIEVRKAYKDENLADTVQVGEHPFRY
ncbi:MAG TPA: GNAT family N-acetyltransferase, partial [Clostridiaceae bacterium]|nr:GNAT family N-acetyltransferase [Clostridiaceae bacterium]